MQYKLQYTQVDTVAYPYWVKQTVSHVVPLNTYPVLQELRADASLEAALDSPAVVSAAAQAFQYTPRQRGEAIQSTAVRPVHLKGIRVKW